MAIFMTPRQVAERWTCSPRHVRRLCASGELRAMRVGDLWRISEGALAEYEYAHSAPEIGGPEPTPAAKAPARVPSVVDGFTLPADYEPVFPELWKR